MTPQDGPSLETYIETRFNLLSESIRETGRAQAVALEAAVQALTSANAAADLRYQQRFDAQADALAAAFLSQQVAMKTALEAAKEAVNAALAAADRAVLKAELAADKRFEALNELRQMLNDTLVKLLPRTEAAQEFKSVSDKIDLVNRRADKLEERANVGDGQLTGGRRTLDNTRLYIGLAISIVIVVIAVATFILARTAQP